MKLKAFGLITIVLLLGIISLVTPVMADSLEIINNISPFNSPYGLISVNATVAKSDYSTLAVYHGTYTEGGSLNIQLQQIGKKRQNVPNEQEAPALAQRALESYGGLPQDAVLEGSRTSYSEYFKDGALDHKEALFTTVSYSRNIDGLWIIGESNSIIITLGENGEPLWILKEWRNYTHNGNVKIIPVTMAFEKLRQGDIINGAMVENDTINIDIASLGYYAKKVSNSDTDLEPVWMMFGPSSSGSRIGFYVYARQFANFTSTPASGTVPLTVSFTDTSDASPVNWYWDFGDGTNSIEQSPTHTYTTKGTYNVSLRAWNDLGSDTIVKTNCVKAGMLTPPIPNFTATPVTGKAPLTVQFDDTTLNTPTGWDWDFGDGYISTQQNPVHQYDISGNFTVSLNATNADGSAVLCKPAFITVTKPSDPITLIAQLIVYIQNQNNLPKILQRMMVGELNGVKYSLQHNHPDDAVMGMKVFKLTVSLFKGWPLTSAQAATLQNSADAIIKEINLPVNQAAIDQTKSLSADVKALNLQSPVAHPLLLELEGAVFTLECAKDPAAITHLNMFISSVKAQDGKEIPHDKAVQLVTKAQGIITTIKP